jgi:hypothetical protein
MAVDMTAVSDPSTSEFLKGVDDRFILGQLDEPAEAESLHGEDAELLGVERQHHDHHDGGEHEHVDQESCRALISDQPGENFFMANSPEMF